MKFIVDKFRTSGCFRWVVKPNMQPVFYFTSKHRTAFVCTTADRNNIVPFFPTYRLTLLGVCWAKSIPISVITFTAIGLTFQQALFLLKRLPVYCQMIVISRVPFGYGNYFQYKGLKFSYSQLFFQAIRAAFPFDNSSTFLIQVNSFCAFARKKEFSVSVNDKQAFTTHHCY